MSKFCFADVETTGTVRKRHRVWEVGLVVVEGNDAQEYCWQVAPDLSKADPMALRINRFYERCQLLGQPVGTALRIAYPEMYQPEVGQQATAGEVALEVAKLVAGSHLFAANVAFDQDFTDAFLRANGQCPTWDYHLVEMESYVAGVLGWAPPWKLDKLMAEFGVTVPEDQRHTALGDAVGIFELWKATRSATGPAYHPKEI